MYYYISYMMIYNDICILFYLLFLSSKDIYNLIKQHFLIYGMYPITMSYARDTFLN